MEKKFLDFNGKQLYFTLEEGVWYVALKPICEALGVQWNQQHQNVKHDKILGPASRLCEIQVPDDQGRSFFCLPEKFVYGWLFQIQSDSPELVEFKWKCYEILYDHFEGTLTRRQATLSDKSLKLVRKEELEEKLLDNPDYTELQEIKAELSRINKSLKVQDEELATKQGSFF